MSTDKEDMPRFIQLDDANKISIPALETVKRENYNQAIDDVYKLIHSSIQQNPDNLNNQFQSVILGLEQLKKPS